MTEDAPSHLLPQQRLEDDRVAPVGVGANLVEMDGKSCSHEVAWPPDQPPPSADNLAPPRQRPGPPARLYPFQIDPFQQVAVNALEAGACLEWMGLSSIHTKHTAGNAVS
jgi:hypothetical protein